MLSKKLSLEYKTKKRPRQTDKEIQVKNDGYYIFSRKYKELLRVTEVKYYSYIAKPSDIRNELIIVDQ